MTAIIATAFPSSRGAAHKACALIIAEGPRTIEQLFAAIDFGAPGTEKAKIKAAIEAGWIYETPAGTIDVTESTRAHFATPAPKREVRRREGGAPVSRRLACWLAEPPAHPEPPRPARRCAGHLWCESHFPQGLIMIKKIERAAFSLRLREALRNAGLSDESPTILQRNINVRGVTVTVHAARKWLLGEAIPTQEKLTAIATWLGVAPDWLRFGTGDATSIAPAGEQIAPRTLRVLESFGHLVERDQMLVQAMIDSMLRVVGGAP